MSQLYRVKLPSARPRDRDSDRYQQTEAQARMSEALARLQYIQRYSLEVDHVELID